MMSVPMFILGYYFLNQLTMDTIENREKVSKGFKWMYYYTIFLVGLLIVVILVIPSSEYPDEIENAEGKTEKLDEETIKSTLTVLLKNEQDILRSRRNMKLQQQHKHDEQKSEEYIFDELEADLKRRSRRRRRGRGDLDDPFSGYEQLEN